ncbi:MAG: transcription elongation factor GreA [Anaerolineales bacterium]
MVNNNQVYLTEEGRDKLEAELEHLKTVRRQEVAERLHEAMEGGELIENAEMEAAKNEQAFVEGRILELEDTLSRAKLIQKGSKDDIVHVGDTVTIKEGRQKSETYTIVGAAEASPKNGLISNESPLGQALLEKNKGDIVEVKTPSGVRKLRIVKVD